MVEHDPATQIVSRGRVFDRKTGQPVTPPPGEAPSDDFTVAELRQQAKAAGVTGYSGMSKAELQSAIAEASEQADGSDQAG